MRGSVPFAPHTHHPPARQAQMPRNAIPYLRAAFLARGGRPSMVPDAEFSALFLRIKARVAEAYAAGSQAAVHELVPPILRGELRDLLQRYKPYAKKRTVI